MKIEVMEIAGLYPALYGMRNPMDSWEKSDTVWMEPGGPYTNSSYNQKYCVGVGKADHELSVRLQKAGPEHCKHLRMVQVYANITAPRYWWTEFDTYRAGVEKVSCSTMHRLMARPLELEDFAHDAPTSVRFEEIINYLNFLMDDYKNEKNPVLKQLTWKKIIQTLPQSYLQKRTVMMSYAALRNMYRQREGHKLSEWHQFRDWIESLPESWMITE